MNTFKKIGLFFCIGIIGVVFGVVGTMQWDNLGAADEPAHEHPLTKITGHAATCKETGIKDYWECPDCAKYFADAEGLVEITSTELANWKVIEKAHHETNEHHHVTEIKANCAHDGNIEYYTCMYCGDYFEDANCEKEVSNNFVKEPKASKCNEEDLILVPEQTTDSCTHVGHKEHYECKVCEKKYMDKEGLIPADDKELEIIIPHNYEYVDAVASTCTEAGHIAYYQCFGCGSKAEDENGNYKLSDSDVVTPKAKHEGHFVDAIAATCETAGNCGYYQCDNCPGKFTDATCETEIDDAHIIIEALGHDYYIKTTEKNNRSIIEHKCCHHCNLDQEAEKTLFAEIDNNNNTNIAISETGKDLPYSDFVADQFGLDWANSQKESDDQIVKISFQNPDVYNENGQYVDYNGDEHNIDKNGVTLVIKLSDLQNENRLLWHFDWDNDGIYEQSILIIVENFQN